MALASVKTLKYDLHIEELGKTIKYRGLKHGEQKNILLAFELKDESGIINVILDSVESCTFNELDVKTTPMHLIDLIFLKMYAVTVGAKSPVVFSCGGTVKTTGENGEEKTEPCGTKLNMFIDLDKAALVYPENYTPNKTVQIDDDTVVKLKVPSFEDFRKITETFNRDEKTLVDLADQFIWAGLEAIVDSEGVKIPSVDFTKEELFKWLDDLDPPHVAAISEYFDNLPQLVLDHSVTCPKCGRKEEFQLKGLDAFFG